MNQLLYGIHEYLKTRTVLSVKDVISLIASVEETIKSQYAPDVEKEKSLKRTLEKSNPQLYFRLNALGSTKQELEQQIGQISMAGKMSPAVYTHRLHQTLISAVDKLNTKYKVNLDPYVKNQDPLTDAQATLSRRFLNTIKSPTFLKDTTLENMNSIFKQIENSKIINVQTLQQSDFVLQFVTIVQAHASNIASVKNEAQCEKLISMHEDENSDTLLNLNADSIVTPFDSHRSTETASTAPEESEEPGVNNTSRPDKSLSATNVLNNANNSIKINYSFYMEAIKWSLVATGLILISVGVAGFAGLPGIGIIVASITTSIGALSTLGGLLFFSQEKNNKPYDKEDNHSQTRTQEMLAI